VPLPNTSIVKGVFATRGGEVSLHRVRTDRTRVLRHGLRVTYLGLFRDQTKNNKIILPNGDAS